MMSRGRHLGNSRSGLRGQLAKYVKEHLRLVAVHFETTAVELWATYKIKKT